MNSILKVYIDLELVLIYFSVKIWLAKWLLVQKMEPVGRVQIQPVELILL